jgi:hypothetical protein
LLERFSLNPKILNPAQHSLLATLQTLAAILCPELYGFAGKFDFQTVLESQSLFLFIDPNLLCRRPWGRGSARKDKKMVFRF